MKRVKTILTIVGFLGIAFTSFSQIQEYEKEAFRVTKILNDPVILDSLVASAHANSGLLQALDFEAMTFEEEILQNKRNWVSAFTLGVNVFSAQTTTGVNNQSVTSYGILPNLGLNLNINPEKFVNRKSQIRLSSHKRDRIIGLQVDHMQRIKVELLNLYYDYLTILETLVVKQRNLDTRKQHLDYEEVQFRNGNSTYDKLMIIQNQVILMEEDLIKARIDAVKKKKEIETITGC